MTSDLVYADSVDTALKHLQKLKREQHAQLSDTIRVDGTSPRGRGQEDVKASEQRGASECSKVKYKAKPLSEMLS